MTDKEKLERGFTAEEIRDAFQRLWKIATNQPGDHGPLMSIPPRRGDVDFIIRGAIDELEELRGSKEKLEIALKALRDLKEHLQLIAGGAWKISPANFIITKALKELEDK